MCVFRVCLVVDAWGKLPSAIFQGNLFEFGGFSECFHIERNENVYKTQYCMADLVFDFNGIAKPRLNQHNIEMFNIINMSKIRHPDDEFLINTRMAVPQ